MVICDRIRESKTEYGVFDLKGVRQGLTAPEFPLGPVQLRVFMVLSNPRPGVFPGYIRVVNDRNDRAVFHGHLSPKPEFRPDDFLIPIRTRIRCSFPEPGMYSVQIWFFQKHGSDVLKSEMPLYIYTEGE
jgi:hypothetical protein